jgi:hypothetical protein
MTVTPEFPMPARLTALGERGRSNIHRPDDLRCHGVYRTPSLRTTLLVGGHIYMEEETPNIARSTNAPHTPIMRELS